MDTPGEEQLKMYAARTTYIDSPVKKKRSYLCRSVQKNMPVENCRDFPGQRSFICRG